MKITIKADRKDQIHVHAIFNTPDTPERNNSNYYMQITKQVMIKLK